MTRQRVLIVGAGFAGIAAAYKLIELGIDVVLIERNSQAGGLSRTFEVGGELFDIGPHIFFNDEDPEINSFWNSSDHNFNSFKRKSFIFADGKWFNSPIRILNVIKNLGLMKTLGISFGSLRPTKGNGGNSSEAWFIEKYGLRMYKLFFASYNTKFWGYTPSQLSADWVHQRARNSLFRLVYEAKRINANRFVRRPRGGSSALVSSLLRQFENRKNFKLLLNVSVNEIRYTDGGFSVLLSNSSKELNVSQIIYSGYPDDLASAINGLISSCDLIQLKSDAASLVYRNVILVCIVLKKENFVDPDVDWIEVYDYSIDTIRVSNFSRMNSCTSNWSSHNVGLQLEYNCFEADSLWNSNKELLLNVAIRDLKSLKLIKEGEIIDYEVFKIQRAYPVYTLGYEEKINRIKEVINSIGNLFLIGRNGNFRFDNVNQAVKSGFVAADLYLTESKKRVRTNLNEFK